MERPERKVLNTPGMFLVLYIYRVAYFPAITWINGYADRTLDITAVQGHYKGKQLSGRKKIQRRMTWWTEPDLKDIWLNFVETGKV